MATLNKTERNWKIRRILQKELDLELYRFGEEVYGTFNFMNVLDDFNPSIYFMMQDPKRFFHDYLEFMEDFGIDQDPTHPMCQIFLKLLQYWNNCME